MCTLFGPVDLAGSKLPISDSISEGSHGVRKKLKCNELVKYSFE